ncbi:hypothetical protein Tco_0584547 [Tanacetum coccineum]
MKPKEPTYQVALDALAITTCYPAFLITVEVPVIYMHQFWATVDKHKASYRFKIDNKKFPVNVEVFRDILNICPRIQGQEFDEHPTEAEALSFIRELSHSGEIKYITNVIVDHLHQPWRTFASIINKCLCRKVSGLDKIRLSRVQILWGMYYKKNLDFVALIWEDLAYQIDNIDSKKQDKMFYHRFTKIIIHHFLTKDKSILMRNKMFMHAARDDSVLGTIRFVSRHADTQVYGEILPETMTNQALLDSVAYKNYYVIASGVEPPKSRKSQKKSDSAISSEESPSKKKSTKAKKVASAKSKPTKKKASVKADRGKGLNVLSKAALSKAAQLKEVAKRSKKDFHISHASGSGDGTDFESGVPDEQHHKTSGTDKGTSTKPGVPNVPKYDSESDKESWGNSGEEDEDDENDSKDENGNDDNDDSDGNDDDDGNDGNGDDDDDDAKDDDNQEDDDTNDDDEETDSDKTVSDRIKIPVLNQSSTEYYEKEEVEKIDNEEKMDEKEDDEVTKELYDDVNMNLGNRDADMTDVDQADNEIASLMDTTVHHKEPGSQTSSLYTVPITAVPEITSVFTTTIPPPPPFFNPLPQQATLTPTPITSEATTSFPSLPDFSFVFKFNDRVTNLEKDLSEIKQVDQYAQALSFISAIILIDNIEKNKSYDKADYKMELYDALVKSYQTGKDLFDTYGEVFTLKRSRDDREKDQDPSAGSDRGTKRRKSRKEAESFRDSRSKEKESAHAEELIHTVDDSRVQQNQEFDTGNNDEQPTDKEVSKVDWFKKPERPQTPDPNWNKRQHIDFRPPQAWISQVARAEEPQYHLEECSKATTERLDWHNPKGKLYTFDLNKPLPLILDHRGRQVIPQDYFINNDLEYLKGGDLSKQYSTSMTKTKAATYEIKWIKDLVHNLWSPVKVIEGDFPRLRLQDIEDMLLLLVQQKLTNLIIEERYDLNVALRMFTRWIFIQRLVEDLHLGVESYQKKLSLTKLDTFRSNLKNRTTYTAYSDPKIVIYKDQNNRNRLMHADELHKSSDGMLNDVWTALHGIASRIRMEYLPKRKWSGLEKTKGSGYGSGYRQAAL